MPSTRSIDYVAARELQLFAENDHDLYRQKEAFIKNVARKMLAGRYKPSLAPKLWIYFVDRAADAYARQFGHSGARGKAMFPKAVRQRVARLIAAQEAAAIRGGEYGQLRDLPRHLRL
jgi:hypothetical protein